MTLYIHILTSELQFIWHMGSLKMMLISNFNKLFLLFEVSFLKYYKTSSTNKYYRWKTLYNTAEILLQPKMQKWTCSRNMKWKFIFLQEINKYSFRSNYLVTPFTRCMIEKGVYNSKCKIDSELTRKLLSVVIHMMKVGANYFAAKITVANFIIV